MAAITKSNRMESAQVVFRQAEAADLSVIWEIFQEILQTGGTYTLPKDYPFERAVEYWMGPEYSEREKYYLTRVALVAEKIVGVYAIRPCYPLNGASSHVANASYIVDRDHRGQGIARKMGEESFVLAKKLGYRKMQFNQVVSTNVGAVRLWQSLGLTIIGRSPGAFIQSDGSHSDLLIMHRDL